MTALTKSVLIDLEQFQVNKWIAQQVNSWEREGDYEHEFEMDIDLCEDGIYTVYANCSFSCRLQSERVHHNEVQGIQVETLYTWSHELHSIEVEVLDREGDPVDWHGINSGIIKRYLV